MVVTNEPLLRFRDVTLEVDGRRFLDGAHLSVSKGESVVVAGLPASGKSFVLRLLLGLPGMDELQVVRHGEVMLDGQDVFELNGADLQRLRRRVGFVMRGGGLIENMDIRRNVTLPIQYHFRDNLPDGQLADRRCSQLLDTFGLNHLGVPGLRPVALNAEQRVYVSLARAFMVEPFLLLLDDIATGLPPVLAKRLCQHVYGMPPEFDDVLPDAATGELTRVVTTADLLGYVEYGDRFVLLDEGQLIDLGDRLAVESSADSRLARFLGTHTPEVTPNG
ncbi:MAG: ATP-binding cassette domain-containing protein [Gemmatimonadetes bacterium]|jgi:ABC-type transporter Mla maintaining outer membrane lipid asymmetry ATPase subunit MlaF|nr:ATP-binding cassette domain-containing protein [Gemmatimonadota bacterium]MBT5059909.1 ATP-binding cassette domain-containing protein [Gemmatimonadota bacterium]MBT5142030.1 ATP-binding cassette domain-containing protein [Gemmatimonadota bacterium]MBT5589680.1 ATP-binding cassette domain-containing protein [Gemmatimonadota bacterium]MBT6627273.1 ATP-binding cassette domain-containing protein [Gemmatimonadota bacterium]